MKFVHVFGECNRKVIFSIFFFTIVAVYALLKKGFSLLNKKEMPASWWKDKRYDGASVEVLKRQF